MSTFANRIQKSIKDAQSVEDLISLMQYIPLSSIKNLLSTSLKPMSEDKLRAIHYNTRSIEDATGPDVIQSILSYIPHEKSIKNVSKSFNQLAQQNESLEKTNKRANDCITIRRKKCMECASGDKWYDIAKE